MDYKIIDYKNWDYSGKGKNIINLFERKEKRIWDSAFLYQDKRDDSGHAETATYFALKLLKYFDVKRGISIPSIILHDVGWSQMSQTELDLFYDWNWERYEPVLRARHQEEGARLAKKILTAENYCSELINPICEIISGHDTRKETISIEDAVVKSADRIWRFTFPHAKLAQEKRKKSLEEIKKMMKEDINKKDFFYDDKVRKIAHLEMNNTFLMIKSI